MAYHAKLRNRQLFQKTNCISFDNYLIIKTYKILYKKSVTGFEVEKESGLDFSVRNFSNSEFTKRYSLIFGLASNLKRQKCLQLVSI